MSPGKSAEACVPRNACRLPTYERGNTPTAYDLADSPIFFVVLSDPQEFFLPLICILSALFFFSRERIGTFSTPRPLDDRIPTHGRPSFGTKDDHHPHLLLQEHLHRNNEHHRPSHRHGPPTTAPDPHCVDPALRRVAHALLPRLGDDVELGVGRAAAAEGVVVGTRAARQVPPTRGTVVGQQGAVGPLDAGPGLAVVVRRVLSGPRIRSVGK